MVSFFLGWFSLPEGKKKSSRGLDLYFIYRRYLHFYSEMFGVWKEEELQ